MLPFSPSRWFSNPDWDCCVAGAAMVFCSHSALHLNLWPNPAQLSCNIFLFFKFQIGSLQVSICSLSLGSGVVGSPSWLKPELSADRVAHVASTCCSPGHTGGQRLELSSVALFCHPMWTHMARSSSATAGEGCLFVLKIYV